MLPIESITTAINNYKKTKGKNPPLSYIMSWIEMAEKEEQKVIMTAWADGWRERDSRPSSSADIDEQMDYYNSLVVGF
jgi:hypothetical protein